jgi:hypothetical protein
MERGIQKLKSQEIRKESSVRRKKVRKTTGISSKDFAEGRLAELEPCQE